MYGRQSRVTDIFWLKLEIKDPNTFAWNQITRFPLKTFVSWEKEAEREEKSFLCKWRRQVASPDTKTKETSELLNAALLYGEAIL